MEIADSNSPPRDLSTHKWFTQGRMDIDESTYLYPKTLKMATQRLTPHTTSAIKHKTSSEQTGGEHCLWLALAEGTGDGIVVHDEEAVTGAICNNQP